MTLNKDTIRELLEESAKNPEFLEKASQLSDVTNKLHTLIREQMIPFYEKDYETFKDNPTLFAKLVLTICAGFAGGEIAQLSTAGYGDIELISDFFKEKLERAIEIKNLKKNHPEMFMVN